jgi:hypothetical protein
MEAVATADASTESEGVSEGLRALTTMKRNASKTYWAPERQEHVVQLQKELIRYNNISW